MKLFAEIAGEKHAVEIKIDGERVTANIDGRAYELEVSQPDAASFLIKNDGKIHSISVSPDQSLPGVVHTHSRRGDHTVKITDPKRLRGVAEADGQSDGPVAIKTAMPGKVVRILVVAGAEVVKGDGIIVVEAMKMQNELKSPKDGTVRAIRVEEGATVAAGETLATID